MKAVEKQKKYWTDFSKSEKNLFLIIFGPDWPNFNSTSLHKKSGKTNEQIFHKVQKTLLFWKIFSSQLVHFNSTSLHKISGKTNQQIFHKVQKTLFLGIFGPKLAKTHFGPTWRSYKLTSVRSSVRSLPAFLRIGS